jgi:hypothetical protein
VWLGGGHAIMICSVVGRVISRAAAMATRHPSHVTCPGSPVVKLPSSESKVCPSQPLTRWPQSVTSLPTRWMISGAVLRSSWYQSWGCVHIRVLPYIRVGGVQTGVYDTTISLLCQHPSEHLLISRGEYPRKKPDHLAGSGNHHAHFVHS